MDPVQVVSLGGDPRRAWQENGEMRQRRKKANEGDVNKQVTSVGYWSSVLLRTSVGGQYRTV